MWTLCPLYKKIPQSGHRKCGVRVFATIESTEIRTLRIFILVGLVTPSVSDKESLH